MVKKSVGNGFGIAGLVLGILSIFMFLNAQNADYGLIGFIFIEPIMGI